MYKVVCFLPAKNNRALEPITKSFSLPFLEQMLGCEFAVLRSLELVTQFTSYRPVSTRRLSRNVFA